MIAEEKEQELKRARHEGQMETEKVDKYLCTLFFVHLLTYIYIPTFKIYFVMR